MFCHSYQSDCGVFFDDAFNANVLITHYFYENDNGLVTHGSFSRHTRLYDTQDTSCIRGMDIETYVNGTYVMTNPPSCTDCSLVSDM